MSETDAEFLDRMEHVTSWREIDDKSERDRLFALARRGAGLIQIKSRWVEERNGEEWIETTYVKRTPLPPPPAGETE